jgi:CRP/FNR family cyclic AMP-dependent transcriptional regulator
MSEATNEAERTPEGLPRRAPEGDLVAGDLPPQERARLFGRYGRRFAAGETILQEGTPARESFLLHEGRVRLLRRVAMIDRSLAILSPGDLFGEGALLEQGDDSTRAEATYGSTAIALTEGALLTLDRAALASLIERHPRLAVRIVTQLAGRLRDAEDQMEIMLLRGVQSKVVSALLKLARGSEEGPLRVAISPVELSARVGLDVDAVRRTVQRLRDRRYLRIEDERIEITDVQALRKLHVLLGTQDDLARAESAPGT